MDDMGDDHKCNICNKLYSSYKTLWTHNKNIHKLKVSICNPVVIPSNQNVNYLEKSYKCKYCDNNYSNRQNKWKHEQKCKIIFDEKEKQNNEIKLAEIKIAEINKEIKLAEINSNKEIKLAEINLELKKVEIKKENSIIQAWTI